RRRSMHSDPVADMLTRIRNGCRARLQWVKIPGSKLKLRVAEILKREGFIEDFREVSESRAGLRSLEVKLRYDEKRQPVISGIQRVSSPGLRKYYRYQNVPKVRNGLGVIIL